MNKLKFLVFTCVTTATILSGTSISSVIYAQQFVKGVSIGPDQLNDGEDVFQPESIMIDEGDSVLWTNDDFGIHTVTNQGLFSSKDLRPDQTFEYTFENAGRYDYHCKLHPEMVGKIVVN